MVIEYDCFDCLRKRVSRSWDNRRNLSTSFSVLCTCLIARKPNIPSYNNTKPNLTVHANCRWYTTSVGNRSFFKQQSFGWLRSSVTPSAHADNNFATVKYRHLLSPDGASVSMGCLYISYHIAIRQCQAVMLCTLGTSRRYAKIKKQGYYYSFTHYGRQFLA